MAFKIFVAMIALGVSIMVQAHPEGAPTSVCSSMSPSHDGSEAQTSPFPYEINFADKPIKSGESITVTIKGRTENNNFKGIMVQARVDEAPVGTFDVSASSDSLQTMNCPAGEQNTVTQKKLGQPINEVTFTWIAPEDLKGDVKFVVTVVESFRVFWVREQSATLKVE